MGCQTPADFSKPGAGLRLVAWEGHGLLGSTTASPCQPAVKHSCDLSAASLPLSPFLSHPPLFYLGPLLPSALWAGALFFSHPIVGPQGCPAAFPEPLGSILSCSFFSAPCGHCQSLPLGLLVAPSVPFPGCIPFVLLSPSLGLRVSWKSPAFPFPRERSEVTSGPLGIGSCWGREWSDDKGAQRLSKGTGSFPPWYS